MTELFYTQRFTYAQFRALVMCSQCNAVLWLTAR